MYGEMALLIRRACLGRYRFGISVLSFSNSDLSSSHR